jgi:hypothetical protein
MNTTKVLLSIQALLLSSWAAVGCAGTLSPDEADSLRLAHSTSGGDGVTSGTTTGAGGAGGGSPVDMCMTALVGPTAKACGLENSCHGGMTPMAGLVLDQAAVSIGYKNLLNKSNNGTQPTDGPLGCQMGKYKLIDPASPTNSLIYQKVTMQPCGGLMPIGLPLNDTERACVLSWINSVIAAP